MIGVVTGPSHRGAVEEFFQLFKTPWEFHREGQPYDVLIVDGREVPANKAKLVIFQSEVRGHFSSRVVAGGHEIPLYAASKANVVVRKETHQEQTVVSIDYNLWHEFESLLTNGQPVENAQIPALDLHIDWLRRTIVEAGANLIEIPPMPSGYSFTVALTHDIDFIGIRQHRFDHTLAGFLFRSTVGAVRDYIGGKSSLSKLARIWKAVGSLPLIHLGLARDFWLPFEWYLKVEQGIPATYYFIPFKNTPGEKVAVSNAHRRGCAYDIGDIPEWARTLQERGCEVAVHGIDGWHSVAKGNAERERLAKVTGTKSRGIRMHWLLRDDQTPRVLEEAGYDYDSTVGYNETVGYWSGTAQVYRQFGNRDLLELPMHIQDGALFYPQRLNLSEAEAWGVCQNLIAQVEVLGGVLTFIWHDRSHGPERFWGEFYCRLVDDLKRRNVWFASAGQVVQWFRKRREIGFARGMSEVEICGHAGSALPGLTLRVHEPGSSFSYQDFAWDGIGRTRVSDFTRRRAAELVTKESA